MSQGPIQDRGIDPAAGERASIAAAVSAKAVSFPKRLARWQKTVRDPARSTIPNSPRSKFVGQL